MHEMSLMADLMRKAESVVRSEGGQRAALVRVRLGAMAHMSPSHLRGHFEDFSRGSLLEGAELEIEQSEDKTDPNAQSVLLLSVDVVD